MQYDSTGYEKVWSLIVEWGSSTFWSGVSLSFLRKNVFAFVVRTCRTLHGVFAIRSFCRITTKRDSGLACDVEYILKSF